MIEPSLEVFPNNIIKILADSATALDGDLSIFRRPLRTSDPNQSIGVFPGQWVPDERTQEMGRINPGEPTMQQYIVGVQAFVKDGDEEVGLARHSALSYAIRSMLYRDASIRLGFQSLSYTSNGVTERLRRWGIRSQRFLSNELSGSWLYLSTLEVWAETDSS
jgi:hypothetical protein